VRARTYGVLLLALAGMLPLIVFGYLSIQRSQRTAVAEVRAGNDRLAGAIAQRIAAYTAGQRELLASVGAAALQAGAPERAQALLDAYELRYRHFNDIAVYDLAGQRVAGRLVPAPPAYAEGAARALDGVPAKSDLKPAEKHSAGFAHTMVFAEPVVIAGKRRGAVVARMDLVGIWPPVHSVRVGDTGFVRLITVDGQLLAHGNPEERRSVYNTDPVKDAALVAAGLLGRPVENHQGDLVISSVAFVPDFDWLVTVEQAVSEAFAGATAMGRDLIWFAAVALALMIAVGVLFGGYAVRGLERLRAHTRVLAGGKLDARVDSSSRLVEVRALGDALDDMAASLARLQAEARARERLATFARVAAGLAHDLRQPVEAVRDAVGAVNTEPDDRGAKDLLRRIGDRELPRLKRFVDDLQRLAKRGDLELEVRRVEPAALARSVAAELSDSPKWRGVTFVAEGEAGAVAVDEDLVRRAVTNLAGNGADACLEGGPGGEVRIEVADGAQGEVEIRVHDTGPGIPAERVAALFEGDFVSTKRTSGVGLGLGVVRQVADAHGGTLQVSSVVGKGSTFTLVLPQRVRDPAPSRGRAAGHPPPGEPRAAADPVDKGALQDAQLGTHGPG
jgi:signal transduction histidine kinase